MSKLRPFLLITGTLLIGGLAACASEPVDRVALRHNSHFWQRTDATSAIYMRGPKAQQMLNRDISRCVSELRELHRLGAIRRVTPAEIDEYGIVPDPNTAEGALATWGTPERDGFLRAEYMEYHDFETCMMDRGWERLEHAPYDIADEGRDDYIEAIIGQEYQTHTRGRAPLTMKQKSDYDSLNYD